MEVWRWTLQPGEDYPSHPHQPGVVETISVTRGQVILVVEGTEYPVTAGGTATFDGDVAHTYRGAGTGPCELIMTVHLPPVPPASAQLCATRAAPACASTARS